MKESTVQRGGVGATRHVQYASDGLMDPDTQTRRKEERTDRQSGTQVHAPAAAKENDRQHIRTIQLSRYSTIILSVSQQLGMTMAGRWDEEPTVPTS